MDIDTILLIIGVIGLSISGWVLRGYFLPSSAQLPHRSDADDEEPSNEPIDASESEPAGYVSFREHEEVLKRIELLEKTQQTSKTEPGGEQPTLPAPDNSASNDSPDQTGSSEPENPSEAETWKEIYALQQAYRLQREKEKDVDYSREESLFDLSQGYNGRSPDRPLDEDEETEQRMQDNQLETGEEVDAYQQRISHFSSLSREMLVMRLEAADAQLLEQQTRHQASLLAIITSLIEKMPGDVNLKSIAQASFVAASAEISDEDGAENRANFQRMFNQSFGR